MAKRSDFTPDRPMTPEELAASLDVYFAAWTRCKMERHGKPPQARSIQKLVRAWKALRKAGSS